MISALQALMLSTDLEGDLRAAYSARIAEARGSGTTRASRGSSDPLRALLVGYSGACNTGADLRTGEIVRRLRSSFRPNGLELGVLAVGDHPLPDWGPVRVERIEGYPPDAVHDLCVRYDAVVVCEGSSFTSTFSNTLTLLLTAFLGMATALGKPAVVYGAEADHMSPEVEDFVRVQAAQALLIARNVPSQRRLAALGLKVELGTDTGWSYRPVDPGAAEAALRARGRDDGVDVLVVCPTNPYRWPLLADPERALIMQLSGQTDPDHYEGMLFFQPGDVANRRCAAFIESVAAGVRDHAARHPRRILPVIVGMEANDRQVCVDLARHLNAPDPLIAGMLDPGLIVGVLRLATRLVSARYHALLFAMVAGVPAVGLAYDQRVPALLADAGHAELSLSVDTPNLADAVAGQLDRLVIRGDAVGRAFAGFAAAQQQVQAHMDRRVATCLAGA